MFMCHILMQRARWLFSTFVPRRLEFDPRARTGKDARQRKFHALRFPVELSIDAYNSHFNTALTALCGVLHQCYLSAGCADFGLSSHVGGGWSDAWTYYTRVGFASFPYIQLTSTVYITRAGYIYGSMRRA